MPLLTVRDGARSVVRRVEAPTALDALCPAPPPVPYAAGWLVRPDGDALELIAPSGERHGTIAPGAALELGAVTLAVAPEPTNGATAGVQRTAIPTERLAPESRPRLALEVQGHPGRRAVLGTRTFTIGKNRACDLHLTDPAVSDVHCRIVATREGWQIRDEQSTNGTYVNGVRVEAALLRPGTPVVLGRTRILCVRARADADDADEHGDGGARKGGGSAHGRGVVLVGESAAMHEVRNLVARFAPTQLPVLVHGETGAGKELVARMIHDASPRARGPFVAINAASIAPELVESELFGHERGAFTGAANRRRGVFEEASGGTLFLDELGELPLAQQAKLLRVLETGEVRRVGAEGTIRVDARVVAATHRDLRARVLAGLFREDLRYRLDVLRVVLPPLRERREDIPLLVRHLMARVSAQVGRACFCDDHALAALLEHDWPGNVRELYGVLCRAAAVADGERVGVEHLSLGDAAPTTTTARGDESEPDGAPRGARASGVFCVPPPPPVPADLDGEALRALVASCGGNLSRAARAAKMARSTLRDRLERASAAGSSPR